LRGIARQASISAPSIYRQFANLDVIIEAVLAQSFAELTQVMATAAQRKRTPAAELLASCRAYVAFGWEHRARYRLMFAADGYADDAVTAFTLIEGTMARAVAEGQSTSHDPHTDTFLLWTAMHGLATLEKPRRKERQRLGPIDRPGLIDVLVQRLASIAPA
jgi:AcrR family transcriptional regulator